MICGLAAQEAIPKNVKRPTDLGNREAGKVAALSSGIFVLVAAKIAWCLVKEWDGGEAEL